MNRITRLALLLAAAALLLVTFGCASRSGGAGATEPHEESEEHHDEALTLSPEAIANAGIEVGTAGAHTLGIVLDLPGEIRLNAERTVDVHPQYAGLVTAMLASVGAGVRAGDPIARVYGSESLSEFTVTAPLSGTVVARTANPGTLADPGTALCTLSDLANVWLELPVSMDVASQVTRGARVSVLDDAERATPVGTIAFVEPVLDADTRSAHARVVLANADGRWQPGRLVRARVEVARVNAALAVPEEALVRLGTSTAVFVADSNAFVPRVVVTGRSDGAFTEILSGLSAGTRIATRHAVWLKAELEKEAGGHDH